jgi:hypothetical protein
VTKGSFERLEQLKLVLDRGRTQNGALYGLIVERAQKWILHFNAKRLHGPEEITYGPNELVVVCLVRDGRPYVRSFVEHYRSLGVKHIVFLDNGSTDGTVEALKEHDDVTVLRSKLPYERYNVTAKQYLIERFGRGRWILCADIDELFDYPHSDIVSLDSLLGYLNDKGYTAVAAQMLDMFPEEPLSEAAGDEDEPLKERHKFYDVSSVHRWSYVTNAADARDHWAYRRGLSCDISEIRMQGYSATNTRNPRNRWVHRKTCGARNVLANEDIEVYTHGIQSIVFGDEPPLTKHPLVFVDEKIRPNDLSDHSVSDARLADFTCVLFHYKFLEHFYQWVKQVVRQDWYFPSYNSKYKKWLGVLEKNPSLRLKRESARELGSVNELVENGFLVVSEEYMMLAYNEERKSGGDAQRGGEPGEEPEDEAAFYRAKAQAKVQSLRARRLERRLEELQEQNLREVEKLRRVLMKVRKKSRNLSKKSRNLRRQLRSMRSSRSWRLLSKLGRIWAKLPSRKQ